ncbi:MAG: lysophospholipid acyltransferase family protein [Chloroflexota bacterium]|nr:lysophospholipid acyltransferase family protein [Chloroflexota bacterium]
MSVGNLLGRLLLLIGAGLDGALSQSAKYRIASLLAGVVFASWQTGRENAIDNMSHVLGKPAQHPETRRVAKKSMENYSWYLADFLGWMRMTPKRLQSRVRGLNWVEHIYEALQAGKGAILVSGDLGVWDLGGAMLAQRFPVLIPVDELQNGAMNWIACRVRERLGIDTVPAEMGLRAMLRQLQANRVVGLLFDRPMRGRGVPVTFFGSRAHLPSGPAALALRTGAPLVMCQCQRLKDNGLAVTVYPPIYAVPSDDDKQDIERTMQQLTDQLEEIIRSCPEQWYMFRSMWPQSLTGGAPTEGQA